MVSEVCRPGAGLLDVRPTSTQPRHHWYVLMAGINDIDAGCENTIFTHLEGSSETNPTPPPALTALSTLPYESYCQGCCSEH
ncbi:hypothetical protein J6590_041530 [Homalodisca vitripennis]|nr:hypothetical protein J6590_041530 [Homalodisca vitripennis]